MRQVFNDELLQSGFMEDGFVQVPMLSATEVEHILSKLPEMQPADNFAPTGDEAYGQTYHCSFLDKSVAYKRRTFALITKMFGPYVEQYLCGYRILSCNFYVKPPGTGTFVIHQNWPTIENIHDTTVTVWCPLADVVAENGALQFVRGSHKILPHVEGPVSRGYFDGFRQTLIDKYLKPNALGAGQALIFDDGLLHWSANNDSDVARVAIQIACVPVDTQPVFFYFDAQHPERFEMVEAGPEFYLSTDMVDLTQRQPHWKSVGFVENRNRFIDEQEFAGLLARGPELRREIYASGENPLKRIVPEDASLQQHALPRRPGVLDSLTSWLPKLFSTARS